MTDVPRVPGPWSISIDPGRSTHICIGQPGCYRVEWAQNASWAMFIKIDDEPAHALAVERQGYSDYRPAVVQETACAGRNDLVDTLDSIARDAGQENE